MANFKTAIEKILKNEGAYQANPKDKGNYNSKKELVGTNWGISALVLEKYLGYPPSSGDMKKLSKLTAIQIYYNNYWVPLKAHRIENQDIAELIFDHAVNTGVYSCVKLLQKTLNSIGYELLVDGKLGPLTLNAVNSADPQTLFELFKNNRISFYQKIKNSVNKVFYNSWIKRVMSFTLSQN